MEKINTNNYMLQTIDSKPQKIKKKYRMIKRVPFNNLSNMSISHNKSHNIFDQLNQQVYANKNDKIDKGFDKFLKSLKNNKKNQLKNSSKQHIQINNHPRQFQVSNKPAKKTVNFAHNHTTSFHEIDKDDGQTYQKHSQYSSKKIINLRSKSQLISQKLLRTSPKKYNIKNKSRHDQWINSQNSFYQGKMGYINENYYKKPLVQRYGNRYFQYILRNRYQDDLPPPVYIHQIQSIEQNQLISTSKFIKKIKNMNSSLNNRQRLIVKGRKIETIQY